MLLKKIEIENTGPIDHLTIDFPFTEEKQPKPVVIVGENGTGKTIFLSHLVNSLIAAKQAAFDDPEIEEGKVYKYRSPAYIKAGSNYSFARVEFEKDQYVEEWQLDVKRTEFEETHNFTPARKSWTLIPGETHSDFKTSFTKGSTGAKSLFASNCCLYFPVNRYEEPAWLNAENLKERVNFNQLKKVSGISNRSLLSTSPLKSNRNWLLDILLDRSVLEAKFAPYHNEALPPVNIFMGYAGEGTTIYNAATKLLRIALRSDESVRFGIGTRKNRIISVMKDEKPWVPDLFQLSTGEILLLNLFLSIIRDYDLSGGKIENLSSITGVVIVDEIDAHLHTIHQREVLPDLIAAFPGVQFILTSHSPLFLIGMRERFGDEGFHVISMPTGTRQSALDFSEISAAYDAFKETSQHRLEIERTLRDSNRPIIFVEGDYDIRYITRAAKLLGKDELLSMIQLKDGTGFGNLDKIWKSYDSQISEILPQRVLLLYDCDTNKIAARRGMVSKRVIPSIADNPITIGIENLFPEHIINQLSESHPQFIDQSEPVRRRVRGAFQDVPAQKSINKDEKGNMCSWMCENGTPEHFRNFVHIFSMIDDFLSFK